MKSNHKIRAGLLSVVALALLMLLGSFSGSAQVARLQPPPPTPGPALVVNSVADPGGGVCDLTECTLREAIDTANASAGMDLIHFDIPGLGPHTIQPVSELPIITDPLTIDGYTQPGASPATVGSAGTLMIELDGSNAGSSSGLLISAGNSTVRGLVINRFQIDGVALAITGGNVLEGNYIGISTDGAVGLGNTRWGVVVTSEDNTIGGASPAQRNVVSANVGRGIFIFGLGATGNHVRGNYVGTDADGSSALGNAQDGVRIEAPGNTVGGTIAGAGNVIAGNGQRGVVINSVDAAGNSVQGNHIGVDASGVGPLGNGLEGVAIFSAPGNTIGGTTVEARNVISNNQIGVRIFGSSASGNQVQGNYIGTDVTGTGAAGNTSEGVWIDGASDNTIGGPTATAANVISNNTGSGVSISGSAAAGNQILSNSIESNGGLGIDLGEDSVTANDAGDSDVGPNGLQNFPVITNVDSAAVTIQGTLDSIAGDYRLEFFASTTADPSGFGEGERFVGSTEVLGHAGGEQAFLASFPTETIATGEFVTATATNLNTGDTSEFSAAFEAPPAIFVVNSTDDVNDLTCDSTHCSLREAIIAALSHPGLDRVHFNIPAVDPGCTALACTIRPQSILPVVALPTIIDGFTQPGASPNTNPLELGSNAVLKIELDGSDIGTNPGWNGLYLQGGSSVRGLVINRFPGSGIFVRFGGGNIIEGNHIGSDPSGSIGLGNGQHGVHILEEANNVIGGTTAASRNVISDNALDGVKIFSQPGIPRANSNLILGNYIGTDASGTAPLGNGSDGVEIGETSQNNRVGGTNSGASNLISGNISSGIRIHGSGTLGNVVQGNYIGTDAAGTSAIANSEGILIVSGAENNTVGGATPGARNIISGNTRRGIGIVDAGTAGNLVQGNYIGTDPTGAVAIPNGFDGVLIQRSPNNTIGGTTAGERNIISGNTLRGIFIDGAASTDNVVQGNYIGTDPTGTSAIPNQARGVFINSSPNNTIGGTTVGARNIISGNTQEGLIIDSGSTGNMVRGNYIGTDPTGTVAIPNGTDGVHINGQNTTIGGTTAAARNVISGNTQNGLVIRGSSATGNLIQGNFIGTEADGTAALANGVNGVLIRNAASNNTIGGTTAGSGNLISGNNGAGVSIGSFGGAGPSANFIQGNYIGTNATGTAAISNGGSGLIISNGGSNNTVGGAVVGARNVISGNQLGIVIGGLTSSGNVVQGNYIGTNADGTAAMGNADRGVLISGNAPNNTIGGTMAEAANVIAHNGNQGIHVQSGIGNALLRNAIFSNGSLGIDLNPIGITPNDFADGDSGANGLQNYPLLASATSGGGNTTVDGTLDSTPSTTFTLQFFSSPTCDPSGFGEGETFLGSDSVITDGIGIANFSSNLPGSVAAGDLITATATDPTNNTSEFSACVAVSSTSIVVTNTSDSGPGSLRGAIVEANLSAGADLIEFDITGGGPHTIQPQSALPIITDPVVIDGYTQTGASPNANPPGQGSNAVLQIELDGSDAGAFASGVEINSGNSTIRGLVINSFDSSGIAIYQNGGNVIEGNFIGTDTSGSADEGNGFIGILIDGASDNTVGGTTPAARNVISGNDFDGIVTLGPNSSENHILGNFIGTDASGSLAIGNGEAGIRLNNSPDNHVGGIELGARNVISGNLIGIVASGLPGNSTATGNEVIGNYIGTDVTGTLDVGNTHHGLFISGANNNFIGPDNVISGNDLHGVVFIDEAANNQVLGNYIGADYSGAAGLPNGIGVSIFRAPSNLIGGDTAEARNILSGNLSEGILIQGSSSIGNIVRGNFIGTDLTGATPLANGGNGIRFDAQDGPPSGNIIGGAAAGEGNLISANQGTGVVINRGSSANQVLGNFIGTDVSGTLDLGNASFGVRISDSPDNRVEGNTIAHNFSDGVRVMGSTATGNATTRNSIFDNFFKGIENFDGGNAELEPPVITGMFGDRIEGTAPANSLVEVFADSAEEGRTFLIDIVADVDGNFVCEDSCGESLSGPNLTATATDGTGNTSEFSLSVPWAPDTCEPNDSFEEACDVTEELNLNSAGSFHSWVSGPGDIDWFTFDLTGKAEPGTLVSFYLWGTGDVNSSASGGTDFTLSDVTQSWDIDEHTGKSVTIYAGTGTGQIRAIASNSATTLTVSDKWSIAPDFTSQYKVGADLPANFDLAIFVELDDESIGASPIQGVPIQGVPIQGVPIQGVPIQGVPIQGVDTQAVPIQGVRTEAVPIQGVPIQGVPIQGVPIQGVPIQGVPIQGVPIQGVPIQGVGFHQGTQAEQLSTLYRGGMTGKYFVLVWSSTGEFSSGVDESPYELTVSTDEVTVPGCTTPLEGVTPPDLGEVTPPAEFSGDALTLIVLNRVRMATHYSPGELDTLQSALNELATDTNLPVHGMFVDLADVSAVMDPTDPLANARLKAAYDNWDEEGCDPVLANAVTLEIKAVINQALADNPTITQLVFVGNDLIVPHRRVPDGVVRTVENAAIPNEFDYQSQDGSTQRIGVVQVKSDESPTLATLRLQYYLSDDFYGDPRPKFEGLERELSIPEYPIGRLVETPSEIEHYIQVFIDREGELDVNTSPTSLTTGYSFLEDVAGEINAGLDELFEGEHDTLISPDWTEANFTGVYGSGGDAPDITSANAHFDHFRFAPPFGAGEVELVTTGEIGIAPPTDMSATLFFSVGCHVGFNFWDSDASNPSDPGQIDWAQFFVGEGATLIGSWGYAYGDDALIAYTEELMLKFAKRLGLENPGLAMVEAKKDYFLNQAIIDPVHEKILMQTIFYGLPMWQLPPNPYVPPSGLDESHVSGMSNGLTVVDYSVTTDTSKISLVSTNHGDYYSLAGETQAAVHRPAQPQGNINVGIVAGEVAHGVLFTGGTYTDTSDFDPVITTASWTLGVPEFQFLYEGWDPARFWSLAQLERSNGTFDERLAIVVGQFLIDEAGTLSTEETVGIQRLYNSLNFEIFYNTTAAEFEPPIITGVDAGVESNPGTFFSVEVEDASGIVQVLVTYTETDGGSSWESVPLVSNPSTGSWEGTIPTADPIHFFVQALDAAGNVGMFAGNGYFAPVAVSVIGPAQVTVGEVASFTASLPGGLTDENILWDFGDGAVEEGEVAVDHMYSKPGSYSVQVRVVDREGNLGVATTTIAVSPAYGTLEQLSSLIQSLPDEAFKSPGDDRRQDLLDKLAAIEDQIARGEFNGAIQKLENDFRKKMDGCGGSPDSNDWIIDCDTQFILRALIDDLIGDLRALP